MKNILILLLLLSKIYTQVVAGVNGGLVTVSPTANPGGSSIIMDRQARAQKVTTPAFEITIIEIGWYSSNASDESKNYEVAIYDHDAGNDEPENLLAGGDFTNSDGTTEGWKVVTGLSIVLSASTIYWIAVQLDNTALTAKNIDQSSDTGERDSQEVTTANLKDPWDTSPPIVNTNNRILALYALYTPPTGTNMKVNISDVWKDVDEIQINIGDAWKTVDGVQINIGDTWETVY